LLPGVIAGIAWRVLSEKTGSWYKPAAGSRAGSGFGVGGLGRGAGLPQGDLVRNYECVDGLNVLGRQGIFEGRHPGVRQRAVVNDRVECSMCCCWQVPQIRIGVGDSAEAVTPRASTDERLASFDDCRILRQRGWCWL